MSQTTTVKVKQFQKEKEEQGFAFPYVSPNIRKQSFIKFGIVTRKHADTIKAMKKLSRKSHNKLLDTLAIRTKK